MPHSSKRKGNNFERELVNEAKQARIDAERAYASNGRSLGLTKNVDCLIGNFKVQAKRRKKIASYLKPDSNIDIQILRGDREPAYAVIKYSALLELIRDKQ